MAVSLPVLLLPRLLRLLPEVEVLREFPDAEAVRRRPVSMSPSRPVVAVSVFIRSRVSRCISSALTEMSSSRIEIPNEITNRTNAMPNV